MWSAICSGIGYVLEFFYGLIPNYAVALLLFALAFKLILLPFSIKQQKNSVRQAKLRPKEMAIRKKYKGRNDQTSRQRMQQEIMELQQREGVSPFGGCLPLLLQMPIIFALYSVIRNPLQYIMHMSQDLIGAIKGAIVHLKFAEESALADNQILITQKFKENFDAIKQHVMANPGEGKDALVEEMKALELGSLPNFNAFGDSFNLAAIPEWASWLVTIPIITFVVMFISMKLTRKLSMPAVPGGDQQTADAMKSMQLMDLMMPLLSTWIAFKMPAVIGLYWIYQSVFGIGQQFLLRLMYPFPVFTEEDYKEAEREILGKNPKKKKKKPTSGESAPLDPDRPRPRSLHYIDADDDDETPTTTVRGTREDVEEEEETTAVPATPVPLKEDAIERPCEKPTTKKKSATKKKETKKEEASVTEPAQKPEETAAEEKTEKGPEAVEEKTEVSISEEPKETEQKKETEESSEKKTDETDETSGNEE